MRTPAEIAASLAALGLATKEKEPKREHTKTDKERLAELREEGKILEGEKGLKFFNRALSTHARKDKRKKRKIANASKRRNRK